MKRWLVGGLIGITILFGLLIFGGGAAAIDLTPFQQSAPGCNVQPSGGTQPSGQGQLTGPQVAAYLSQAGWSGPDLVTIVAIAKAESGWNAGAVQKGQPQATTGWGLLQVTPGDSSLLDPLTNAKAGYAKYKAANGFTPWTTYTGGAYKAFLTDATNAVNGIVQATTQCVAAAAGVAANVAAGPDGNVGQVTPIANPSGIPSPLYLGFPEGQCTWLAAWLFTQEGHTVNWHGNATDWTANAAAAGHQETLVPTVGAVVVYGSGGGYSSYGHVAVVVAVKGNTFQVEEENYLGPGLADYRWSSTADVTSFITS